MKIGQIWTFEIFCLVISCISLVQTSHYCGKLEKSIQHEFYPLRHCQRSNGTIIGLKNFKSLEECANFAREKFGLAFNYGSKKRGNRNRYDLLKANERGVSNSTIKTRKKTYVVPEEFYNCQVLECPEYGNFTGMINDTRFDYYSLYTRPPPLFNSTCIPSVGMFVLSTQPTNYSLAYSTCRSLGGSLAHVISETRTNALSKYLIQNLNLSLVSEAYVGLNETSLRTFNTSAGESYDCFLYRAWAPGYPPQNRKPGCVALTTENSWKVFNCRHKLPFICELHTSGPNPWINVNRKCSIKQPNNRFIRLKEFTSMN